MITKIITVLIVTGLVYLGLVQVFLFIRKRYYRLIAFCKDMKVFLKSRKEGSRIIEIKIREPTKVVTEPQPVPISVIIPVAEPVKPEAVKEIITETVKEPIVEIVAETPSKDLPKTEVPQENEKPEETLFISLNIEGKEYNSSDDVSAEELMVMSRTLSNSTATLQDEIATVRTLYKIRNTTLFADMNAVEGNRIKGMFDEMTANVPKIGKQAGYDYSRHIKN